MWQLTCAVRHYPWGSRTVIPDLLGQPSPAAQPHAEMWLGAHPGDPSVLDDGRPLDKAIAAEGALHLDDVLTRRTRVSIETSHRGVESAPAVAALMSEFLGWDAERTAREVRHYDARVAAERESQRMPDDMTADAARLGAPDVRAPAV